MDTNTSTAPIAASSSSVLMDSMLSRAGEAYTTLPQEASWQGRVPQLDTWSPSVDDEGPTPIDISEVDNLKMENAYLKCQIVLEKLQEQGTKIIQDRETLFRDVCYKYLPEGKALHEYTINFDKGQLIPIPVTIEENK